MHLFGNSNRINYKNRIFFHILITMTILAAMIYFGIYQSISEMEAMGGRIDQEKIDLEKNYIRGQKLRELAENLKIVEPELEKLESIFIKKEEALNFITSLENVADKNGITQKINLANANRGNIISENKNETIPIQLSSSGNFYKEMLYLANLEALNYYINVKNIEISNGSFRGAPTAGVSGVDSANSENIVGIQILADTYWQN